MFQRENSSGMAKGFSKATMMLTGAGKALEFPLLTAVSLFLR